MAKDWYVGAADEVVCSMALEVGELGLMPGTAFFMATGGRVFFSACRMEDVVKNRGLWKLLEG